jgi:uncharacterized MAPEG superfamily protein
MLPPLPPALEVLVVCASLLLLNVYALGLYVSALRGRAGLRVNPEDGDGSSRLMTATDVPDDVGRANRAHRNAVENIPGFLILASLAVWAGCPTAPLVVCLVTFTAGRFAHTAFYLRALQPWRSIAYGVASASQLGVIMLLGLRVFR